MVGAAQSVMASGSGTASRIYRKNAEARIRRKESLYNYKSS
jgi:hypothetical protein